MTLVLVSRYETAVRVPYIFSLQVPEGDVLLHAGDFTEFGETDEVIQFKDFLLSLNHSHKACNHYITCGTIYASNYYNNECIKVYCCTEIYGKCL